MSCVMLLLTIGLHYHYLATSSSSYRSCKGCGACAVWGMVNYRFGGKKLDLFLTKFIYKTSIVNKLLLIIK